MSTLQLDDPETLMPLMTNGVFSHVVRKIGTHSRHSFFFSRAYEVVIKLLYEIR